MVRLTHNFKGKKFMWLYAKYANGCNPEHHCTNAIKGKYSKRFSRLSKEFLPGQPICMDEYPQEDWDAIYICGVSRIGYSKHENYPHNVHVVILPREGERDEWSFENWRMTVENGIFEGVISEDQLKPFWCERPEEFRTCRMYRWAVAHYIDKEWVARMIRKDAYGFAQGQFDDLPEKYLEYKEDCLKAGGACENYDSYVKRRLEDGLVDPDQLGEYAWGWLRRGNAYLPDDYDMSWEEVESAFYAGIDDFLKKHRRKNGSLSL